MTQKDRKIENSSDYIEILERVKKQYQQYIEVSGLYKLPTQKEKEIIQYQPPSPENPLTTNTFCINKET